MSALRWCSGSLLLIVAMTLHADGPADNIPDKVRPVPPEGINDKFPEADRAELRTGVERLGNDIAELRTELAAKPDLLARLPDVQIYHNAVRYALTYNEFYDAKEVPVARKLLQQGTERAKALRQGNTPWTTQTGLVARGYVSKIDGSVQPYGIFVPASYLPTTKEGFRLDLWCHGRGEKLTELSFVNGVQNSAGQFVAPNTFVLQLYGRYCCANKFAGEIDCLEAMADVEKHYPIDANRRVMRGFSMGGAACWQFAVHYPSLWCAAAPGAGFSETADFLKVFQKEDVKPTWYEQKLWHMYDCTDYARNLYNLPTVAYSGEKDSQKQAADMMEKAMKREGLTLPHLIGPGTGHAYHPETKKELIQRIDAIAEMGRKPVPERVKFTTYTLRYNRSFWVQLDGLEQHWERADIEAALSPAEITVTSKNVAGLTLAIGATNSPFKERKNPKIKIDDQTLDGPTVAADLSWTVHLRKKGGRWEMVDKVDDGTVAKRPGLQGPIDDAFMDSFLVVRPTGTAMHEKTGGWVNAEMKRALEHWRKQFRGEARVKDDAEVTEADIAQHNLILWGDPSSNKVLAKIADKLPVKWVNKDVTVGKESFAGTTHMPILIQPNPLNPKRYVVLNSGFTFRDYDYLNNARQISKLPDYAVIDVTTPPSSRFPGKIVAAGFFDERWQLGRKD